MFSSCSQFLSWCIFHLNFFPSSVLCYLLDSLVSHSGVVKWKLVFSLKYFVDEINRFISIDFWQLLSSRVKVINDFPGFGLIFGILGV